MSFVGVLELSRGGDTRVGAIGGLGELIVGGDAGLKATLIERIEAI